MPKFEQEKSYFLLHTDEQCGVCMRRLTHPPILLPAGRAYVDQASKSVQSPAPLLKYPTIKCCHECAIVLLAPELEHDPNHPNEGKWWREWQTGNFEPLGLSEANGDKDAQGSTDNQTG